MPYIAQFVPAAVFLKFRGVTIYHTYDDNDVGSGSNDYVFGLTADCTEEYSSIDTREDSDPFEVRKLPDWREMVRKFPPKARYGTEYRAIRETIKAAIRKGLLKNPEEQTLE